MKTFRRILVALIIAALFIVPLALAAGSTGYSPQTVVHIAGEPTPTPTPINSGGGCHGFGC